MTSWYVERAPNRPAMAVIAATLFALLLVAAVPVALLAAVVMMMLGHLVGGLALFGGSVLAAALAVALAGGASRADPGPRPVNPNRYPRSALRMVTE